MCAKFKWMQIVCCGIRASPTMLLCGPVMEVLDEVHQLNPVESTGNPEKIHSPGGSLEQPNKHSQIIFIDCSLFLSDWVHSLIGPSGLLLVVSHLFAVPVLVLWEGLEKS